MSTLNVKRRVSLCERSQDHSIRDKRSCPKRLSSQKLGLKKKSTMRTNKDLIEIQKK